MKFTRIEYFLTAARYLNFTKAAAVLYISQPSLSKQIALLEEEVGVRLFYRTKKHLELTPAGKQMYADFVRLLPEISMAIDKVKTIDNDTVGTLHIGCVETVSMGAAATQIVWDFTARMPEVRLFIERCSFEALRNKVLDGSIDVAFTISHQLVKMRDILSVEIEQRRRYIILSTNHRLAGLEHVGFEHLREETFVLLDRDKSLVTYDDILGACAENGFYPKIRYVPNNGALLDYLELASCVAFLDKSFIENRTERLKCYPTDMDTRFSLVCIWKRDNRNPILSEFIRHLPH